MALLWADGFGVYGDSAHFAASGFYTYSTNDSNEPLLIGSGANARTGTYFWSGLGMSYSNWQGGRMIGGNRSVLGVGMAFLFSTIPTGSYFCLFKFCGDNKDTFQVSLVINDDGSLSVVSGQDGSVLGSTAAGVMTAGAYPYVEMKVLSHASAGTVDVHVNNVPRLSLTGINTAPAGNTHLNGIMVGRRSGGPSNTNFCQAMADFVMWDTTTAFANDFLGDRRCYTFFPNSDGSPQDWTPTGGGSAFSQIDNVPFNPAQYIAATAVNDISRFGHANSATNVDQIAGINVMAVVSKSDAGTCEVTPQIVSSGDVGNGTAITPGTGSAYYNSLIAVDPHTGTYFTKAGFDAASLQVERTA